MGRQVILPDRRVSAVIRARICGERGPTYLACTYSCALALSNFCASIFGRRRRRLPRSCALWYLASKAKAENANDSRTPGERGCETVHLRSSAADHRERETWTGLTEFNAGRQQSLCVRVLCGLQHHHHRTHTRATAFSADWGGGDCDGRG